MIDIVGANVKEGLIKKLESNRAYQEAALRHTKALLALVHAAEDDRKTLENILEKNARGWLLMASDRRSCLSREVDYGLIPIMDAWLTHRFPLPTQDESKPRFLGIVTRCEEDGAHIAVQRYAINDQGEVIEQSEEVRHTFLESWRTGIELRIDDVCIVFAFHASREWLIKNSGVDDMRRSDGQRRSRYGYHDVRRRCLPREDHEKAPRSL